MKVCVLQTDYGTSTVPYRHHDPPRDLAPLLPDCQVDHLFLHKLTICSQLREAARKGYDIYVNLCEGYPDWDVPSIDVIWFLEWMDLPFTGPPSRLYDPSKIVMKGVATAHGMAVPPWLEASSDRQIDEAARALRFPLFVKPSHAGDSLGIDRRSLVRSGEALRNQCARVIAGYRRALIEEYIDGPEYTVLVAADPLHPATPLVYPPVEFLFDAEDPFKTYSLKVEAHHPERNVPVTDPETIRRLQHAAREIFLGFDGEGYARLDFRADAGGVLYFLDINFTCSVFYPEGSEGSADYILRHEPGGAAGFLLHIIREGAARYRRRHPGHS